MDNKKALFIFDGGLAPGYTSVAVALTEEAEKLGWQAYAAKSGFRSLLERENSEIQIVRLVTNQIEAFSLNFEGFPTESIGRLFFHPGSDFRAERFPDFKEQHNQEIAAKNVIKQNFKFIIFCGGDGTLKGAKAISKLLPKEIKTGFINISADSDIQDDRSIGFLSCAEGGAEIASGLYEDAYTHRRIYFLEMMGNKSGRHALHAGSAARAHLIVMPYFNFPEQVLEEIASHLFQRRHALVIVAEGYQRKIRREKGLEIDAAGYFRRELEKFGLKNEPNKRVIAEPFSRFLRGIRPLRIDSQIAYLKCQLLLKELEYSKDNRIMICYNGGEHSIKFQSIYEARSDNSIDQEFIGMIDRLMLPKFREYVLSLDD